MQTRITVLTTIRNDRTGQAGFEEEHQRCESPKAPQRPATRMVDIVVFRAFGRW